MRSALSFVLTAALAVPGTLVAQTHRVQRYEGVTRAVGVYEWTGDLAKPVASRLIPISLFIYGHYEDAAIYLPQPVPMAINSGTRYQLQTSGVIKGNLDIISARNLKMAGAPGQSRYDDGWFGYGRFSLPKPPAPPRKVNVDLDKDKRPELAKTVDAERPTFTKEDTTNKKEKKPKDVASVSAAPPDPSSDDDRPVFRRHDSAQPPAQNSEDVKQGAKSVLADPDRPQLHRGRPVGSTTALVEPEMKGLPPDLHQSVAVSDAVDRPEHDFTHKLSDEEKSGLMQKLAAMARDVLAHPLLAAQMANATATPDNSLLKLATIATPDAPEKPVTHTGGAHHTTRSKTPARSVPRPVAPPVVPLEDESLHAYDLAYNGTPTFVYTAHTVGTGAALKYVTIAATTDSFANLQPIFRSLTDATHLDQTPRMRLVDAVDADASNRAVLVFELRAQSSRQFALYRVYAGRATQVFLTGSTQ